MVILLAAIIGMLWASAQIMSRDVGLAQTIVQVAAFTAVIVGIFIVIALQRLIFRMKEQVFDNPLLMELIDFLQGPWVQAAFLLGAPWGPPVYFVVSVLNQCVRSCRGITDVRGWEEKDADGNIVNTRLLTGSLGNLVTKLGSHQFYIMSTWDYTDLVQKIFVLAWLFFIMVVFAVRVLNIFLCYCREYLKPFNPWLVLFSWYWLGLLMLLCPAIPGPPVYIFGGLVVVNKFTADPTYGSENQAFMIGLYITMQVGWFIKLTACAMQQKIFGEYIGASSDYVRATVGVQKPMIRAIEVVLRQPGINFGKSSILCGGPDWPTSVLCGLLRCSLLQIEIGTFPIILFIAPCVCTGNASILMQN